MLRNASKIISIAIVLAMVVGVFAVMMPAQSTPAAGSSESSKGFVEPVKQDVSAVENRNIQVDVESAYAQMAAMGAPMATPGTNYEVNDTAFYYTGSYGKAYYLNGSYFMAFTKRAENNWSELWTAVDNTYFDGDPRNAFPSQYSINDSQARYMVDQFSNNIYPNETAFFGNWPLIDGSNSVPASQGQPYFGTNITGKQMIMIFNIVDNSFFNPSYPSYIAGYYSPGIDAYYDRNIVNMDSRDWANRTGPQSDIPGSGHYSYVYETTLAHEYHHLLNDYFTPDQEAFLNEGFSEYTSLLCGYGYPQGRIDDFFATPDNSLTLWGDMGDIDILADYGAAGMFAIYLSDQFGPEFIQYISHDAEASGIDSVNAAFAGLGFQGWDFNKVFNCWRLANLIHSNSPGAGLYNYKSITVPYSPLINVWQPSLDSQVSSAALQFGTTMTSDGYSTGISKLNSYGTDYIYVEGSSVIAPGISYPWANDLNPFELKFNFQGDTQVNSGWQIVDGPAAVGEALYTEDFNHGGALPTDWFATDIGSVSGNVWAPYLKSGSDYYVRADGIGLSISGGDYIYERLYAPTMDTMGLSRAVMSFNLDFQQATADDFFRVRASVNGGSVYEDVQMWTASTNARGASPLDNSVTVYLDISKYLGFPEVNFRFDYIAYGGNGYAAIDNLAISEVQTAKMWWSDTGDMIDNQLTADFDLTGMESAILSFNTRWNFEANWDFGFVQVSNDSGESWTSIANEYTTSDYLTDVEAIIESMPGVTGTSPWAGFGLAAFGNVQYDLSEYVDQMVKVRFRAMSDQATSYENWYIQDIELNGVAVPDSVWTSNTPQEANQWLVSLYFPGATGVYSQVRMLPIINNLNLEQTTQSVIRTLTSMVDYPDMIIVVSPIAGPADYGFGMFNGGFWWT